MATHVILDADCERSMWLREVRADQAAVSLQWAVDSFVGGAPANEDSHRLVPQPREDVLAATTEADSDGPTESAHPDSSGEDESGEDEESDSSGEYEGVLDVS